MELLAQLSSLYCQCLKLYDSNVKWNLFNNASPMTSWRSCPQTQTPSGIIAGVFVPFFFSSSFLSMWHSRVRYCGALFRLQRYCFADIDVLVVLWGLKMRGTGSQTKPEWQQKLPPYSCKCMIVSNTWNLHVQDCEIRPHQGPPLNLDNSNHMLLLFRVTSLMVIHAEKMCEPISIHSFIHLHELPA